VISELLAEDVDARVPEQLWREHLATFGGMASAATTSTSRIPVAQSQSVQSNTISTPLSPVPEEGVVGSS
jgi:hypothetical protein